jgi:hypothetical protein
MANEDPGARGDQRVSDGWVDEGPHDPLTRVERARVEDERDEYDEDGGSPGDDEMRGANYWRFAAMIATSMTAMFALTYVNTYRLGDVRWSETRFYMAFIMGAAMAVIMLGFMLGMYRSRKVNVAIFVGSAVVFALALWLVRSQETVQDRSYMRAMIPHHSIAILTSSRAEIDDVRVRELADEIIAAQKREIEEMNWLIDDISENGKATTQAEADARPVPEFAPEDYDG